ncbi:hypothetical protein ACFPA8_07915 [Streptomyces ovatisporus]|uniref:Uncharacterized protein n=1 Tax=Streptomyces ovatisporus TaxID=1128682 RepID=A0ABV9A3L2_9ACTN
MANGWKYVNGEPVWRPDVGCASAQFFSEYNAFYGDQYERMTELLDDLISAVRREAAQEIRDEAYTRPYNSGMYDGRLLAAQQIDPDVED